MKKRRLVILGSTGSIGESALKVARDLPERIEIVGLAANRSARKFAAQVAEFQPLAAAMCDPAAAEEAGRIAKARVEAGPESLCALARLPGSGYRAHFDCRNRRIAPSPRRH